MITNFENIRLENLCVIKGGKRLPKGETLTDEVTSHPYIRARDIKNGKINFDNPKYLSNEVYEKIKRYTVINSDVIITIVGANIGDVAYVNNEFNGANLTENAVKLSAIDEKLNPKYLKYILLLDAMKEYFQIIASGAAQGKLGLYKIKTMEIPVTLLKIQNNIANILSAYDDLIENNLKRIKLLGEMAQKTYEEWFVRFKFPGYENAVFDEETGLPEGWMKVKCFDIMDVLSGGTPKTLIEHYWNGNIEFYTPKDASSICYTDGTEKTITNAGLQKCNSKLYPKNTVFITARGTVGKVNLAAKSMAMNQSCYALKGKNGISQFFLYEAIKSIVNSFKAAASGGVFDTIVVDTFKILPFVLPTVDLIDFFTENFERNYNSIHNLQIQNQRLKEARDILLPRLMTGMIDTEKVSGTVVEKVNLYMTNEESLLNLAAESKAKYATNRN